MEEFDITLKVRVRVEGISGAEVEADFICSNMQSDMSDCDITKVVWESVSPIRDIDK